MIRREVSLQLFQRSTRCFSFACFLLDQEAPAAEVLAEVKAVATLPADTGSVTSEDGEDSDDDDQEEEESVSKS